MGKMTIAEVRELIEETKKQIAFTIASLLLPGL